MNKTVVSPVIMFFVSIAALAITAITLNEISKSISDASKQIAKEDYEFVFWFFRVITALAASAISISIPGMLKVEYNTQGKSISSLNGGTGNFMTMAEAKPTIVAGGAIAVFVLVYLFNPIN